MRVCLAAALLGAVFAKKKALSNDQEVVVEEEVQEKNYRLWYDIFPRQNPQPRGFSNVWHAFEHNDPKGLRENKGHIRNHSDTNTRESGGLSNELIPGNSYADVFTDVSTNTAYTLVRHEGIVTTDGYNLELWRVTSTADGANDDAPAVLLVHGAAQNGVAWINNGSDSIAWQLFDEGYDVWLLNDRMTGIVSTVHTSLTTADQAFWDGMSFVEVGNYDVPAAADYITDNNSNWSDTVSVVAHSTGSTAVLSSMAEEKKTYYDGKLASVVALSTVSRLNDADDELREHNKWVYYTRQFLRGYIRYIDENNDWIADSDGSVVTIPAQTWSDYAADAADAFGKEAAVFWATEWCDVFQDPGYQRYDNESAPYTYSTWMPLKNLEHLGQIVREESFQQWNYLDSATNTVAYAQADPTDFPLTSINAATPIYSVFGDFDRLVRDEDKTWLHNQLAHTVLTTVEIDGGHATPLQAQDMTYFTPVLTFIDTNLPVQPTLPASGM